MIVVVAGGPQRPSEGEIFLPVILFRLLFLFLKSRSMVLSILSSASTKLLTSLWIEIKKKSSN